MVLAKRPFYGSITKTGGTGSLTLDGPVYGFQGGRGLETISPGVAAEIYYTIYDGTSREWGIGTVSADGTTFYRDTILGTVVDNVSNESTPTALDLSASQVHIYWHGDDFIFDYDAPIGVDSYTELGGLTGIIDGTLARVSSGTGIDGLFRYDSTQSATNNGGTIIDGWVRIYDGPVNVGWFGAVSDGATNASAAFRNMWQFLRDDWFDNGKINQADLTGNFLLTSPSEDRANVAVFIMDFPGKIYAAMGSNITVSGSSDAAVFQYGTYDTRHYLREIKGIRVTVSSGNYKGHRYANLFQGRSQISNLASYDSLTTGHEIVNTQDTFMKGLVSNSEAIALDFTASGATRAEGSDGSYTTSTSASANNNNHVEIFAQQPTNTGVYHRSGVGNAVSGLVQSGSYSNWLVDISGSCSLRDFYVEDSGATHQEIIVRSGNVSLVNVHGASVTCKLQVDGGVASLIGGGWEGKYGVFNDGILIADRNAPGGLINNSLDYISFEDNKPIAPDDAVTQKAPVNRTSFLKGTLAASGGSVRFANFGGDGSGNNSKGFYAEIALFQDGVNAGCVLTTHCLANGAYPNATVSNAEHIGTLAAINATVTANRAGGGTTHILEGYLTNNDSTYDLFYEIYLTEYLA